MHKDIRSYFQVKKPQKQVFVIEDDDDVIPDSPDVQIKNKKKESRKKKRILSDDSDEEFSTKKKKPSSEFSKASHKNKSPEKQGYKKIELFTAFGRSPIKRTEPLVKKIKKNTETGIHSDEEFETILLNIDAIEELSKTIHNDQTKQRAVEIFRLNEVYYHKERIQVKTSPRKSDAKSSSKDTSDKKVRDEKVSPKNVLKGLSNDTSDKKVKDEKVSPKIGHKALSKDTSNKNVKDEKVSPKNGVKALSNDTSDKKVRDEKVSPSKSGAKALSKDTSNKNVKDEKVSPKNGVKALSNDTSDKKVRDEKVSPSKSGAKALSNDTSDEKVKEEKKNGYVKKVEESSTPRNGKKRDFSEFVDNNDSSSQRHSEETETSIYKKKRMKSLNESALTDEERHERKRHSAALYQNYLNRSGPRHLGAKTIPEGSPDCLVNCAFLLTGVLDSFEREEIEAAIQRFGGSVKHTISKKVTHLLAGEDAGPAKMSKAPDLGIRIIGEDEFLQMIIDNSKKPIKKDVNEKSNNTAKEESKHKDNKKSKSHDKSNSESKSHETTKTGHRSQEKLKEHESKHYDSKHESHHKAKSETKSHEKSKSEPNLKHHDISRNRSDVSVVHEEQKSKSANNFYGRTKIDNDNELISLSKESSEAMKIALNPAKPSSLMWVDKYKPQSVKQIIGQHGDASCVKKLMNWLSKWYVNRKAKLPKPSPWAKNDDGGYFKAALLSGPPGVGKTTTVSLVCKELGFDAVEFNASDTRNKTLIREQIGELLTTTSLAAYAKGNTGKQAVTKKHVLVMDEVDGMAGNEDRGGLQELIALIRAASVPIICMCNDRNSQKMRSLVNYCYDLRFNRPRVEQIKSAMMSICCKEGIKIPPEALTQLIIAANQDVRQTLNLLSMWAVDASLNDNERLKKDANSGKKDIKLGPWEAVRKVFSAEEHKHMSINDKSDLFFYDYSLSPLFVQENYLQVMPHCPKHEILERISRAADSISVGDLVDSRIRRNQAWNLLPVQAMYSSVLPGSALSGHVAGQINFPAWLGKNSRANKMQRLCQEIHAHTRLSTSGSKSSIYLDYCSHLRDAIVSPLIKEKIEGVDKSLEMLESYHLLREDLDSLTELAQWPGQRDPMVLVDSKVKAAMTRAYNKKATALPYAPGAVKRGRAKGAEGNEQGDSVEDEEAGGVEDEGADSDPENDALIKMKSTSKEKAGSSKTKGSSSKDKPSSSKTRK